MGTEEHDRGAAVPAHPPDPAGPRREDHGHAPRDGQLRAPTPAGESRGAGREDPGGAAGARRAQRRRQVRRFAAPSRWGSLRCETNEEKKKEKKKKTPNAINSEK